MIVRSLNVPGSPSAPFTTTVVGKTGERFSFTVPGAIRRGVMPVIVGLFLTAFLSPPASWLRRHKWPPLAATWAGFVVAALVLTAPGFWLVPRVVDQFDNVGRQASQGFKDVQ